MSQQDTEFRNWAGTVVATPAHFVRPRTEDEVVELVRETRRRDGHLRVVGAGHSWNDVAACSDTMVSLDNLDRVIDVDFDNRRVTVQAGIRFHDLIIELDRRGLALLNVGSITEQSVAGAIATGTHGTGLAYGALPTQLHSFRLVTGDGDIETVSRASNPDLFHAASVSFGSLGVMTQVTLQVESVYDVEENSFTMPFEAVLRLAPQLYRDHPRIKFWWLPHTGSVQVYTYDKTNKPRDPFSATREKYDRFMNDHAFGAILDLGRRMPALVPGLNAMVGASYFKSFTRVDRWDRVLTTPMPPVHLENEYGLDVEQTVEMMERVRHFIERNRLSVGFINEVRFVKADENWLSGAYQRDSVQYGAYTSVGPHARAYLEGVENIAYELGARPHWGKDFSATPEYLRSVYPRFDDFIQLRAQLDHGGVFVNDFIRRIFDL